MDRTAQAETQWALVNASVSSAKLQAHHLRQLLARVKSLVESSDQKEHLYRVAGDLISSIPETFDKLETQLDEAQLALAYMGRKQLKDHVSPEAKSRIERAMKSAPRIAALYLESLHDEEER